MYKIRFTKEAEADINKLRKNEPSAMKKCILLLNELQQHPRTGTGKCEQLKHYKVETWSRRITKEHRMVYQIHDDIVEVLVVSAFGHYN